MKFRTKALSLFMAAATLLPTMLFLSSCDNSTVPATSPYITSTPGVTEEDGTALDTLIPETTPPRTPVETDPALEITEIMVANFYTIEDAEGNYTPWVEFRNRSDAPVELSDYTVSVDGGEKIKLPQRTLQAGEYAVIFFNGTESEGSVALKLDYSGKIVMYHGDMISAEVSYTNRTKHYSFLVFGGGENKYPTPGSGSVKARENLFITELMASNSIYPVKGLDCDWIEIYNASGSTIDLSDYYISTKEDEPYRVRLPKVSVNNGEYYILCCEKDVPFKLSKSGESVYITRKDGMLISSVTFGEMEKNTSWTYDRGVVNFPSPGYPNTESNSIKAIAEREGLVISEVISSNTKYSPLNKKYHDVIELYNNSSVEINLSEYYLSDKGSELQKYQLPNVTLAPGGYYIVHCDSDGAKGCAPIGISSSGEKLYVSKADGYITDAIAVPAIPVNRSWGRSEARLVYFSTPSLGKANGTGFAQISKAPVPSVKSGIYDSVQLVTFDYEGTVYYTLDGTEPTVNSKIYKGEVISVNSTMAIRMVAHNGAMIPSEVVTFNYLINIPDYTLPVIKLSMSDEQMFGANGIYTNYSSDREIKGNIAFYLEGNEEFSINCGIKIFGAYSRSFAKKSLQIEFRKEYGTSRLEYPIFGEDGLSSFSNIVLRSGSQASYLTDSMFTDEFLTSLASESGNMPNLLVQDYRPCNLYLNGEYYGVYFIREKIDDDFIADHFNVSEESVTIIDGYYVLKYGNSWQGWDTIWKRIYTKKISFKNDENYKWLADQINLESLADLIIMRAYSGDLDPGNIRFFKSEEYDGGRWNFILFDNDISFRSDAAAKTRLDRYLNNYDYKRPYALFRALMENEQFKSFFLERLAFHLKTTLAPENVGAHLDKIIAEVEGDMPYQIDCWKHIEDFYLPSMARWRSNLVYMRSLTTEKRIGWFVQDAVKSMKLSKADVEKYMGEEFLKYL